MSAQAETLWGQLQQAGVVDGAMPEMAEAESPWYVRVMLGFSGWIAALFLLGFVAIGMEFIIDSEIASIIAGLVALAAAYALLAAEKNDFVQQFGLAVSFAGQALVLFGLAELTDWQWSQIWWLVALLQVVIALLMPNFVQRLVAAYVAVYAFSAAMGYHGFMVSVLVTLIVALIWQNEFTWARWGRWLRPIGYGMTLALVYLEGPVLFYFLGFWYPMDGEITRVIPYWVGDLMMGLLLIAVVARLISPNDAPWTSRTKVGALLAATVVAGVSLEMPGVAVGFVVVLLGFSNGNRILVGLGIASLLFYLSAYYYTLQTTLLVKSELLLATGAVLLLARWAVLRWVLPMKESAHA